MTLGVEEMGGDEGFVVDFGELATKESSDWYSFGLVIDGCWDSGSESDSSGGNLTAASFSGAFSGSSCGFTGFSATLEG